MMFTVGRLTVPFRMAFFFRGELLHFQGVCFNLDCFVLFVGSRCGVDGNVGNDVLGRYVFS